MPLTATSPASATRRVLLVGRPNVGKSALFGALTGRHAHVSNYPGTTVTVSSGRWDTGEGEPFELLDTPGAYSMLPVTEEERVARDALFARPACAVIHVVEAANLDRTLPSTLEMLDAGLPMVLVLNMWDEARRLGIVIDVDALRERLRCPVVPTVAVRGEGIDDLAHAVRVAASGSGTARSVGATWVEEFGPVVDELAVRIEAMRHLAAGPDASSVGTNGVHAAATTVEASDCDAAPSSGTCNGHSCMPRRIDRDAVSGDRTAGARTAGDRIPVDASERHGDRLPAMLPAAMPARIAAALVLRGSRDVAARSGLDAGSIEAARRQVSQRVGGMPPVAAILALRERAAGVLEGAFQRPRTPSATFQHRFGLLLAHPVWGLPFVAAILYFGFYQLVGVVVADKAVGFLEDTVFGAWVMPPLRDGIQSLVPWHWLSDLFVGKYGIVTLGITYALALVLPVVGAFFILFSIVEDSGYFPRLALLCDRLFKRVGLNGRAVITMVLGLGCSTMATVTTRTLESRRDRIIATLLLVLTIPCSAQLGLITALLASRDNGFVLWLTYAGCLVGMFAIVGYLAAKVLPGRNATFHMELVPMRWPQPGNVLRKTWNRLYWYFREVVPLFVYASVLLWLLDMRSSTLFGFTDAAHHEAANALDWIKTGMEPAMALIDQPREAAESFLIGFFRRDFGAAGLFELSKEGVLVDGAARALSDRQVLVGSFTLTLFVPCIASFMMMWKERGGRTAMAIFVLVTVLAMLGGAGLDRVLLLFGWQ